MSPMTLSEEDLLFDLDLELVPTEGEHDSTIYASARPDVMCTPGSGQCTVTCWNCYSYSRCCMKPV